MESKEEQRKRKAREATRRWKERHPEYAERARELQRKRYDQNKEEIRPKAREYMRKRYATDPEQVLATNKAWYERNRDRLLEYDRRRRLANLDEFRAKDRARSRARYAAHPAAMRSYLKEWRRRNPDKSHAYVRAATIKRRRAAGGQSLPLTRGGSNLIENLLPACRRCNRRKGTMTEEEFRAFLQRERSQGLGDGLDGNAGTTRS